MVAALPAAVTLRANVVRTEPVARTVSIAAQEVAIRVHAAEHQGAT
jgi:hypothetical protein